MNNSKLLASAEQARFRSMVPYENVLRGVGIARLYGGETDRWVLKSTGVVTLELRPAAKRVSVCFYDWEVGHFTQFSKFP